MIKRVNINQFCSKITKIMGCEVVFMQNYYQIEEMKDSNYDEFSTLELPICSMYVCISNLFICTL